MNIKIDTHEILRKDGKPLPPGADEFADALKKMISPSLEPLRKEMRREDKAKPCFIMLNILPPDEEKYLPIEKQCNQIRVTVHGYSEALTEKIYQTIGKQKDASLTKRVPVSDMGIN